MPDATKPPEYKPLGEKELLKVLQSDERTTKAIPVSLENYIGPGIAFVILILASLPPLGRFLLKTPLLIGAWILVILAIGYLIIDALRQHFASKKLEVITPEMERDIFHGQIGSQWTTEGNILLVGPRWSVEITKETAIELDRRIDNGKRIHPNRYPTYVCPPRETGRTTPPTSDSTIIEERIRSQISTRRNIL